MPTISIISDDSKGTDHIEQSEVFLGFDQFGQFLPLLLSGVNTGGVLRTGVEQELVISP
jgi:hypothetical protein